MYAKEIAKKIREDIKKLGYGVKQISVRTDGAGYSDSIRIKIKDVAIKAKEIEEIANKYESIRYDEYTGEILEGGNLYIFVEYDWYVVDEAYKPYLEKATEIFETTGEKTVLAFEKNGKQLWYYGGCYGRNGQCFEEDGGKVKYDTRISARSAGEIARVMMFFDAQN